MSKCKVSIIIPIYNAEKWIKRCINSVIKQTYPNLEIILVNDGSLDNSLQICKNFLQLDNRIKIINTNNKGVSSARNIGINYATGKYVQFVDADDYIDEHMTEILVSNIEKYNSDIVICGLNYIYKGKIMAKTYKYCGYFSIREFLIKNIEVISDLITGSPCNKLYKLDIIRENNIHFDPSKNYAEDLIFNYDYLKKSKSVLVLLDCLYNYNKITINSLSKKFRENCYDDFKSIYYHTIKFLNQYNIPKESLNIINCEFANIYVYLINYLYRKDSTLDKKEIRKIIEKELENKDIIRMVDNSRFSKKYFYITWFLVKRKYFMLLEIFYKFKNKIANIDAVLKVYRKINAWNKLL